MAMSAVSSRTSEPQDNSDITVFYVYIILGSLGLIGNAFVYLVMLRYRNVFSSTTNKLIIHQSFVDFLAALLFLLRLFLVVSPPAVLPDNILGSLYCKLWWSEWPQYVMYITSSFNLVAISLERYYATCQPVRHRSMFSSRRLKLVMAASWMCGWISMVHLIPTAYNINGACDVSWPSPVIQATLGVVIFLTTFIIPMAIIIFAYIKIILELSKRSNARVGDLNQDARNMLSKANKNVTKTLVFVAIFFAICWTPAQGNYFLYNLGLNNNVVNNTFSAIVAVSFCINPVIYCFTYERFKKQSKKMVCGGCQRRVNPMDIID